MQAKLDAKPDTCFFDHLVDGCMSHKVTLSSLERRAWILFSVEPHAAVELSHETGCLSPAETLVVQARLVRAAKLTDDAPPLRICYALFDSEPKEDMKAAEYIRGLLEQLQTLGPLADLVLPIKKTETAYARKVSAIAELGDRYWLENTQTSSMESQKWLCASLLLKAVESAASAGSPSSMAASAPVLPSLGDAAGPATPWTAAKLIDVCTDHNACLTDPFFIRKVVYAIDLLGDPASVMALVRTRFMTLHGQGASQDCETTMKFIAQWATHQPWHFAEDRGCLSAVADILRVATGVEAEEAKVAVGAAAKYTLRPVQHLSTHYEGDARNASFLVTFPNPLAFVQLWSLIDLEALRAIRPVEFIRRCWDGSNDDTPNISAYIDAFNAGTWWLATRVCERRDVYEQSKALGWLIECAALALSRKNFSMVVQVLAALAMPAVMDLVAAWAQVPASTMADHHRIASVFCEDEMYKNYVGILSSSHAAIPYLGVFLTSVQLINDTQEADPGYFGWVNVHRLTLLGMTLSGIASMLHFYPRVYALERDSAIRAMIFEHTDIWPLEALETGSGVPPNLLLSPYQTQQLRALGNPNIPPSLQFDDSIDSKDWSLVFASQVRVPFEAGEVLQSKTSANSYLFRIARGTCRVEVSSLDSPPRTVALLGPGALFGETSLFQQKEQRPQGTIIAETDGEVEVAAAAYLRELFVQNTSLGGRLFAYVCIQLARLLRDEDDAAKGGKAMPVAEEKQGPKISDRTAVAERADVELRTLFGYGVGEGVLQRFEGVEMRKVRLWLAGTCYLSQNYLSFHGRMFGLEKKTRIPLTQIRECVLDGARLDIVRGRKTTMLRIRGADWRDNEQRMRALFLLVDQLRLSKQVPLLGADLPLQNASPRAHALPLSRPSVDVFTLAQADWDVLLNGTKTLNCNSGEVVVSQGAMTARRLYYVSEGSCTVLRNGKDVGSVQQGELFGEVSLLCGGPATTSVVAAAPEGCTVFMLEGYILRALFTLRGDLALKFFVWVASKLSERLQARRAGQRRDADKQAPRLNSFLERLTQMTALKPKPPSTAMMSHGL